MNEKFIELTAEACYNVNRAYCESMGDYSQPRWENAYEWQKSSVLNGVIFHLNNPNSKPSDSHENWMKEKLETGWKYGEVKDPEKKEHPCMVPYDQLPEHQRLKDTLFLNTVRHYERAWKIINGESVKID